MTSDEVKRLMVVLGGLILLSGCTAPQHRESERPDDGPLSVGEMIGGVSVNEPKVDPWRASFGGFFLCTEGGAVAQLEGIRVPGDPAPLAARAVVHAKREGAAVSPERFISALGSPPGWNEPYVRGSIPRQAASSYTEDIGGEVVSESCPTNAADDRFAELVMILEAGERGAHVKKFYVDYSVNETEYTLPIKWQLVMCGDRVVRGCD